LTLRLRSSKRNGTNILEPETSRTRQKFGQIRRSAIAGR